MRPKKNQNMDLPKDDKKKDAVVDPKGLIVGQRIKELLKMKNMTQRDLATATGLTQAAISRYIAAGTEKGRIPTTLTLKKLARALDTTSDYLNGTVTAPSLEDFNENEYFSLREHILNSRGVLTFEQKVSLNALMMASGNQTDVRVIIKTEGDEPKEG